MRVRLYFQEASMKKYCIVFHIENALNSIELKKTILNAIKIIILLLGFIVVYRFIMLMIAYLDDTNLLNKVIT